MGHWPLKSKYEKTGSDLITNGSFSDQSNWSIGDSWSIANGIASADGTSGTYLQCQSILTIGKKYAISADIISLSGGLIFTSEWGAENIYSVQQADVGETISIEIIAGTSMLSIYGSPGNTSSIDNVVVKEIVTADTTPSDNHGTIMGATVSDDYTTFDGVNDYMSVPTDVLDSTQGTITVRVYPTATGSGDFVFYSVGSGSNRFYIRWNGLLDIARGNPMTTISLSGSSTLNTWYDVALSWSGTTMTGYLNGVKIDSATFTNPDTDPASFKIGDQSGNFITANIADVRIYDRVLSGNEIQMLYNQGQ